MIVRPATVAGLPVLTRMLERIAMLLPALVLAYPVIVWPLVYAVPVVDATGLRAPNSEVGDYLLNKLYLPPLFLVGLLCAVTLRFPIQRATVVLFAALGLLLGYFATTTLWSLAPDITIRRLALEAVICGAIVSAVASVRQPRDLFEPIVWMFILALMINLVVVVIRPPGPIGHEGIYNHKNSLGNTAALATLLCLYGVLAGARVTRVASIVGLLVCFILLQQSQSKTAMGMAVIAPAVGLYFYVMCRIFRFPFLAVIVGSTVALVLGFRIVGETIDLQAGDVFLRLFGDKTFTGRTFIWQFAYDHALERPWLGHGYAGFWDIGPELPKFRAPDFIAKMAHSHNGYLNIWLETGIVGLALFANFMVLSINNIGRAAAVDAAGFLLFSSLTGSLLLTNLMEVDFLEAMAPGWMLFMLAAAVASAQVRQRTLSDPVGLG